MIQITNHATEKSLMPFTMLQEFKAFIARGNVIDLAVGVIVGAAFTAIVNSLVNDVILPPIGVLLGGIDFTNFFWTLSKGSYPTLAEAQKAGAATLNYGLFLNAVIKFLIVSWAVFILVKQVNLFYRREAEKPQPPASPPRQEVLLAEIRDLLRQRA
jgi:large conductance mechanosensitive channel